MQDGPKKVKQFGFRFDCGGWIERIYMIKLIDVDTFFIFFIVKKFNIINIFNKTNFTQCNNWHYIFLGFFFFHGILFYIRLCECHSLSLLFLFFCLIKSFHWFWAHRCEKWKYLFQTKASKAYKKELSLSRKKNKNNEKNNKLYYPASVFFLHLNINGT